MGTMRVVLSGVLLLSGQTFLLGLLSPPQNVMLTSENFHILLVWRPGSGSGNDTQYEVESRQRSSDWTRGNTCWRNITKSSCKCELYFEDVHKMYWARVRAVDGTQVSEWAFSNELLPYRDTIVGPPKLTLLLVNESLTVKLSMPLTPYHRRNGTYKSVQKVLLKLQYLVRLSEEDVEINNVFCEPQGKITWHTFVSLKPNTNYCVTASMHGQQSKVSVQCIKTPDGPADFLWALAAALTVLLVLLLLSAGSVYFLKLYLYPSTSKMPFPKTLAILNEELNVNLWNKSPTQDLEGASITLISVAGPASNGSATMEQERLQIQLLPGGDTAWEEGGYCANGFAPGSSSSLGQLEYAGTVDSETPLSLARQMKDRYAGERNYGTALEAQLPVDHLVFPEKLSPVSAGLAKDGHMGDRSYWTCLETQIPLHLQVYSDCSSPVSETSNLPPRPSGAVFGLRDLPKTADGETGWPPMFWVDVRLSSVKLPAFEETYAPSSTHLYNHNPNKTMRDSKVDLARLGQSDVKKQEYLPVSQEQHDLPECTELSDDAGEELNPKADSSKIMDFSNYELCPQCLPCS